MDLLKLVMSELTGFLFVAAVTRLKADNPLYGSSHIDYVRTLLLLLFSLSFCVFYAYCYMCLNFQGHIEQWIDFASLEIDANLMIWYRFRMGRVAYLPPVCHFLFITFCHFYL